MKLFDISDENNVLIVANDISDSYSDCKKRSIKRPFFLQPLIPTFGISGIFFLKRYNFIRKFRDNPFEQTFGKNKTLNL